MLDDSKLLVVDKSIIKKIYAPRRKDAHKYDFGHLLVIGGSRLYHGSPTFNALAAYKTGVDLVTILAPKRAADIIAGFAPDLITYPLEGDFIKKKHLKTLLKFSKNKTGIVIGGGAGRESETLKTINAFLERIEIPCVIDADAIYAVSQNKKVIKPNSVITPHAHEFYILSKIMVNNMNLKERIDRVKGVASDLGATILLKGNPDIISDGIRVAINKTGNPYMTKGGTGDTLAGICGSLLAQGIEPFLSACGAAYINGKAGDFAAKGKRQALMASDLIKNLYKVFR